MNKLKYIRKKKCMTRKELSEKSGINIRTIESYEQGYRDLRKANIETILKLCKILVCELRDLLK